MKKCIGDIFNHCRAKIIPQPSASLPVEDGGVLRPDYDHSELGSGIVYMTLLRDAALSIASLITTPQKKPSVH